VEENVSNYNCYLDEKEWLRITSELNSSRLFARIINGDKSWICALGNPIRTGNPESFKQLFVPQWMLHQIHDDGVGEPLEVREIGTGYMMIKRDVFDRFREAYPNTRYKPDHALYNKDGNTYIHAYFDTIIDPETERYLSEDYMFCQSWRKIGGKIYLCPWMQTEHVGTYAFKGDMSSTAKLVGTL
jgi:hypothetical protein